MAPGAQWIACRAFIGNTATEDDLLECADWILAPAGDPANRPHLVNNSWGDSVHSNWFRPSVQAWAAAGIFATFSAGNDGEDLLCNAIFSPADYPEGFTVTAHTVIDNKRTIASFASKGGNTAYLKPNLSAPGVDVISAYPVKINPLGWEKISGTSMAAPHVAGAVALLWSLKPDLVGNLALTAALLQGSAAAPPPGDCGAPETGGGNYTYGHGFLDVYRAGQLSLLEPVVFLPLIER
jgi:subtilisin family serine protease